MDVPFSNKFLMPRCNGCSTDDDYDDFGHFIFKAHFENFLERRILGSRIGLSCFHVFGQLFICFCIWFCQFHDKYHYDIFEKEGNLLNWLGFSRQIQVFSQLHPGATSPLLTSHD